MTFSRLVDPSRSTGAIAASLQLESNLFAFMDKNLSDSEIQSVSLFPAVAVAGMHVIAAAATPIELFAKGIFNMIGSFFSKDINQLKKGVKQFFIQTPYALFVNLPLNICTALVKMFIVFIILLKNPRDTVQSHQIKNLEKMLSGIPVLGKMPDCCCPNRPSADTTSTQTSS